jgi:hypothetical protein
LLDDLPKLSRRGAAVAAGLQRSIIGGFDIDEIGIARAELTKFSADGSGIAFLVEEFLPLVIGRPPASTAIVPAGNPFIDSGSQRNAEHTVLILDNALKHRKRETFVQKHHASRSGTLSQPAALAGVRRRGAAKRGKMQRVPTLRDIVGGRLSTPPNNAHRAPWRRR